MQVFFYNAVAKPMKMFYACRGVEDNRHVPVPLWRYSAIDESQETSKKNCKCNRWSPIGPAIIYFFLRFNALRQVYMSLLSAPSFLFKPDEYIRHSPMTKRFIRTILHTGQGQSISVFQE